MELQVKFLRDFFVKSTGGIPEGITGIPEVFFARNNVQISGVIPVWISEFPGETPENDSLMEFLKDSIV